MRDLLIAAAAAPGLSAAALAVTLTAGWWRTCRRNPENRSTRP